MKKFLLSAGLAFGLGVVAFAPAEAAPISTRAAVAAPASTADVDCRTVRKTVYRNGVKRVTTTRECDRGYGDRGYGDRRYGDRYDRRGPGFYSERRVVRPGYGYDRPRPGLNIRVN
ncbi:hypothetical protein ACFQI3_06550 [Hansschlegelia quercus]|uniref:Antifreeze protein n=1 Tax=Hansschlegelia quercus TaxID=2528245 RepID=A0A4Q9GID1_9HYPH|nr:hypothetical protein [Hansschlegelia quercus]TBN53788.1 hypothetical protein EYR15_08290 [Hansschlegelia quercus]